MLKAELHCHIEGAAEPALVQRLAGKYDMDVSNVIRDGKYVWTDFASFLKCYDTASQVFREPQDYRLLAYDYFSRLGEQGAIYGEVFASPDHAGVMGIGYEDLIDAMSAGIDDANSETGVEGRILVTCVRHLGASAAEAVAELAANHPHPKVTGFGMAGDERAFEVEEFATAFDIAADAGLGLTAHAGEFGGADSVRKAIDHLGVTRVGHGVRAVEDRELLEHIANHGITLEVCPASNISLGVYKDFADHPFRTLDEAGVRVTLNSDDPPYFATSLENEYQIAQTQFGYDAAGLNRLTRNAIEAAFVDEATRSRLLKRLDAETVG